MQALYSMRPTAREVRAKRQRALARGSKISPHQTRGALIPDQISVSMRNGLRWILSLDEACRPCVLFPERDHLETAVGQPSPLTDLEAALALNTLKRILRRAKARRNEAGIKAAGPTIETAKTLTEALRRQVHASTLPELPAQRQVMKALSDIRSVELLNSIRTDDAASPIRVKLGVGVELTLEFEKKNSLHVEGLDELLTSAGLPKEGLDIPSAAVLAATLVDELRDEGINILAVRRALSDTLAPDEDLP
jgi:hypothetical protein